MTRLGIKPKCTAHVIRNGCTVAAAVLVGTAHLTNQSCQVKKTKKATQPKKRPNLPVVNSFEIFKYPHEYWHRSNVKTKHHFSLQNHFKIFRNLALKRRTWQPCDKQGHRTNSKVNAEATLELHAVRSSCMELAE